MLFFLLRKRFEFKHVLTLLFVPWITCSSIHAEETLRYSQQIRSILARNCFACHGLDEASRQGDLRLDDRTSAIDAGAIDPGKPDRSELIVRVESTDSDTVMPTVIMTDASGTIIFADLTDNYRVRPEPDVFLEVFAKAGI